MFDNCANRSKNTDGRVPANGALHDLQFVETLAVASEPRLHRFRPPEPDRFAPRRGGQKPPARAAAPHEVVTDEIARR